VEVSGVVTAKSALSSSEDSRGRETGHAARHSTKVSKLLAFRYRLLQVFLDFVACDPVSPSRLVFCGKASIPREFVKPLTTPAPISSIFALENIDVFLSLCGCSGNGHMNGRTEYLRIGRVWTVSHYLLIRRPVPEVTFRALEPIAPMVEQSVPRNGQFQPAGQQEHLNAFLKDI
jgi:hypothetical protein